MVYKKMKRARLKKITKKRDILEASGMAHIVWREHYVSMIGADQVEYMLEKFQSPSAIERFIAGGGEYFFISRLGVRMGYVAIENDKPAGKMFLSKIYLLKEYRGKGFADAVLSELMGMCVSRRLHAIWLTVNKNNPSKRFYEKAGFSVSSEQKADIDGGFFMDDYIMEKAVD